MGDVQQEKRYTWMVWAAELKNEGACCAEGKSGRRFAQSMYLYYASEVSCGLLLLSAVMHCLLPSIIPTLVTRYVRGYDGYNFCNCSKL